MHVSHGLQEIGVEMDGIVLWISNHDLDMRSTLA